MGQTRSIYVYMDFGHSQALMGQLESSFVRGKEIFYFSYDDAWLSGVTLPIIDPELQYFSGRQYAPVDRRNFGIFLDSSPDRWGRFLMDRREGLLAREEGRSVRKLSESDYLLGVHDANRLGALRFKLTPEGPFLSNDTAYAAPPWTSLRALQAASLALEQEDSEEDKQYSAWLNMLIAPGGSLGGARPKASVIDESGQLWIAKFPSRSDESDVGAWERVAYGIAQHAGIQVPHGRIEKIHGKHHVFLSQRFDRHFDLKSKRYIRFPVASAMTLLQRSDGDDASNGASYLELLAFILKQGSEPDRDLAELWRRIVFNIVISNTDDHLRNHCFILTPQGWRLSPAFDLNPNPFGDGLKLNISQTDNAQDLNLAREIAPLFRLSTKTAEKIIHDVKEAAHHWKVLAEQYGISKTEQKRMSGAFRESLS